MHGRISVSPCLIRFQVALQADLDLLDLPLEAQAALQAQVKTFLLWLRDVALANQIQACSR